MKIGSFTMKGSSVATAISLSSVEGVIPPLIKRKLYVLLVLHIRKILRRRGKDEIIVYKSKKNEAVNRSGWYPQIIIMANVGIKDISNIV
jgi:hypothetical protein